MYIHSMLTFIRCREERRAVSARRQEDFLREKEREKEHAGYIRPSSLRSRFVVRPCVSRADPETRYRNLFYDVWISYVPVEERAREGVRKTNLWFLYGCLMREIGLVEHLYGRILLCPCAGRDKMFTAGMLSDRLFLDYRVLQKRFKFLYVTI